MWSRSSVSITFIQIWSLCCIAVVMNTLEWREWLIVSIEKVIVLLRFYSWFLNITILLILLTILETNTILFSEYKFAIDSLLIICTWSICECWALKVRACCILPFIWNERELITLVHCNTLLFHVCILSLTKLITLNWALLALTSTKWTPWIWTTASWRYRLNVVVVWLCSTNAKVCV